jgi:hypothetical protein
MSESDDHVIPYEEAVRRHRAREARKHGGVIHELKISDAMSHLLEGEAAHEDAGPSPAVLRRIVEREFSDEEGGRSCREPEERPHDPRPDEERVRRLDDHGGQSSPE